MRIVPEPELKRVQIKYARMIIFSQLIVTLFTLIATNVIIIILKNAISSDYSAQEIFWIRLVGVVTFTLFTIAIITIAFLLSINVAHKVIGPLYRIELILKKALSEGKRIPVKIRENDDLHSFVGTLNRFLGLEDEKSE